MSTLLFSRLGKIPVSSCLFLCPSPAMTPQTSSRRSLRSRHPGSRSSRHSTAHSQILLDKFIKHTLPDGSLNARAPFNLKVRGSFFDEDNNVDREKNRRMAALNYREQKLSRRGQIPEAKDEEDIADDVETVDTSVVEDSEVTSPAHVLLYGNMTHHVDSYSVISRNSEDSHVYVSHGSTDLEIESLVLNQQTDTIYENGALTSMKPNGLASIGRSKGFQQLQEELAEGGDYEVIKGKSASSFKLYCQPQLLSNPDHGIKAVFLLPTVMRSIAMHVRIQLIT